VSPPPNGFDDRKRHRAYGRITLVRPLDAIELNPRDLAAIEEAARLLRRTLPVERIVLFGCKARGDDDPESDIDLLVLTARPITRAERHAVTDALFPIQLRHDVVLSTLVVDYYAAFYAASAVMLRRGHRFVKHAGTRAAVHRYLVKPGLLSEEAGRLYDQLFEDRQEGDYRELISFEPEEVTAAIDKAARGA
jgi:uncharacterized protein (UPF0332 family)